MPSSPEAAAELSAILDPITALQSRGVDPDLLRPRLLRQVAIWMRVFGKGRGGLHLENMMPLFHLLGGLLRVSGLDRRARRNVLAFSVTHQVFELSALPPAFSGLKILHLSDLHLDFRGEGIERLGARIAAALSGLSFDLCVLTGDFRYRTFGEYGTLLAELEVLAPALRCRHGILGVLGNHDFIEQVPFLEKLGIRILLNEAVAIERAGQRLWVAGVDDPHFYGTHDLTRALAGVPEGAPLLALVHSPELAGEAELAGVDLYLTGHTHAGQVCLPGGIAVYSNARCPRRLIKGRWRQGRMEGYTSAGTGFSGWPARLNCPPEIAIHELRPARAPS